MFLPSPCADIGPGEHIGTIYDCLLWQPFSVSAVKALALATFIDKTQGISHHLVAVTALAL